MMNEEELFLTEDHVEAIFTYSSFIPTGAVRINKIIQQIPGGDWGCYGTYSGWRDRNVDQNKQK
jgi:hypothetical protein